MKPTAHHKLSVSALGLEMGLGVLVGVLAGTWAETKWDIAPYGVLAGLALGLISATRALVRTTKTARRLMRDAGGETS